MDFVQKSMTVKLLSGRAIQAIYQDDFEPTLLENARGQIQIHGNIQYDENSDPSLISDVDEIIELDLSPITIESFDYKNQSLVISPPMTFEIQVDNDSGLMSSSGDFFIDVVAETRSLLGDEIEEALVMLWTEYAEENDANLSQKAVKLADSIRSRISESIGK